MHRSFKLSGVIIILFWIPYLWADNLKIGVAGPFSGSYVAAGDQQYHGALQAAEDINEKGGINGQKIEIITADDACNPDQAAKAAMRLIKNKVIGVVGHYCSSASIIGEKLYAGANIVMITPASTNPLVTDKGYKTVFRTCGTDDQQAKVAANYMVNNLKAKNIIVIHDSSIYGKELAFDTKKNLEHLGAKVPLFAATTRGEKNYSALIKQIQETPAEVIYFGGIDMDAAAFLRVIREHKIQCTFFAGDGIATSGFTQAAGGPFVVKNVYFTLIKSATSLKAKNVRKVFEQNHINEFGNILNAYAGVEAIAQAIKETGSTDGKIIAQWLHSNKVDSIIGDLTWDEKGDLKNAPFVVYRWTENGYYEQVK